jgi:hypothetical protein
MTVQNATQRQRIVDHDGSVSWYRLGMLDRDDGPADIQPDGSTSWYRMNHLHRADGPAYAGADGEQHWYVDGRRHRLDGPAVRWEDGVQEWWVDGMRVDDTPELTDALTALDHLTTAAVLGMWTTDTNTSDLLAAVQAAQTESDTTHGTL